MGALLYTEFRQLWPELLCKSGAGSLAPRQGLWKDFWLRGATALTAMASMSLCWGRATGAASEAEHEDQLFRDLVKFPRYF